jgi:flagellar basal-body rod protein FlgG
MRTGILRDTDNPFNVALEGPGFMVLDTPRGERYSRAGDFVVDAQGQLSTADGFKVQSVSGQPIDVRGGRVNIGRDGQVTVDGAEAGQLRLVEFEQPTRLVREGNNLFSASDELREKSAAAANTIVEQGSLEMSNVDLPREMIQMMLGMRAYEANQRVIQGIDASIGQLIEQVGMS